MDSSYAEILPEMHTKLDSVQKAYKVTGELRKSSKELLNQRVKNNYKNFKKITCWLRQLE